MNPRFFSWSILLSLFVHPLVAATPNDMFTNATVLQGSTVLVAGTNYTATAELGEPRYHNLPARRSVWYRWQAPSEGRVMLNATNAPGSRWRVSVFTGDILTNLSRVSSNSVSGQYRPAVFDVVKDTEYRIAVDESSPPPPSGFRLRLDHYRAQFRNLTNDSTIVNGPVALSLTNLPSDVSEVRYWVGTNQVGSIAEPPFELAWQPEHTGTNSLSAVILSADGATNFAWPINILVTPANDRFENAATVASNLRQFAVAGELRFATNEEGEPSHGFQATRSLWWQWTPQWNGIATVAKTGGEVLNIYYGAELTNLALVKNIMAGPNPVGTFPVFAGTNYFFQLDGYAVPPYGEASFEVSLSTLRFTEGEDDLIIPVGSTQRLSLTNQEPEHPLVSATLFLGTNAVAELSGPDWAFDFSTNVLSVYEWHAVGTNSLGERRETPMLRVYVSPANDLFENAEVIASAAGQTVVTGNLAQAVHEPWEEVGGRLGSIWYRWVSPFTAPLQFTVEQGAPEIRFFTGDSPTNLTLVTNTFEVPLQVFEGTNYYIVVDAYWGDDGPFQFTLHAPPANDNFANAIEFTGTSGTVSGSNLSAGAEQGEVITGPGFARTIWYKWTAPATGDLLLNTKGSLGYTVEFGAYIGNSISNLLTAVAPFVSSDGGTWRGIRVRADAGTSYFFRLSGYTPRRDYAELVLNYDFQVLTNLPPNDRFAGATLLTELTNTFIPDVSLAWNEPGEPPVGFCNASGRTLWYKCVPEKDGVMYLSSNGSFAVYRGTNLFTLERLAVDCDDLVIVPVLAGESYYIQFDSSFRPGSQFGVELRIYPAPPNDHFENATRLEGTNVTVSAENYAATLQPNEQKPLEDASGKTVWFSWLAPSEGRVMLRGASSHMIGTVQVYQGSRLTNLVRVISIWDNWQTFYARAGEVYHLQVDGAQQGYGDFSLNITHEPLLPATNDDFADSAAVAGFWIEGKGSVLGATVEAEEPAHVPGDIKTIWWHWQAPNTGTTTMRTEGSMVPLILAIYTGDRLELLEPVAKGTNSVFFAVTGGTTYRIAAITEADARGFVRFQTGGIFPGVAVPVPGNILPEGDFEGTFLSFQHWQVGLPIGGYVNEPGGALGGTWPVLQGGGGSIWQDFATIAGEQYEVRFAVKGENTPPYVNMRVTWDGAELGTVHIPGSEWSFWHWTNYTVTASSNITRLKFENLNGSACLDAVSVVWLNEPPSIVTEPKSISAYAGGAASFSVGARGTDPKQYQWFFNGAALEGKTNRTLFIETVAAANQGIYFVEVSNRVGTARSREVTLTVQTASAPIFILQPGGDTVLTGSYHLLAAAAIGTPPLRYQWFHNGNLLLNETNSEIVFESIQLTNAGQYTVEVSNYTESVVSLPAHLRVSDEATGGGVLFFMNLTPPIFEPRIHAPIFDVDGVTGLNSNYVAQIYAGRTIEELRPAGQPQRFLSGFDTGVVRPINVSLANVAIGEKAFVQVRAWDPSRGKSFEIARALGGKFGRSEIFELTVLDFPTYLEGLKSFSLQAGLPEFNIGRLVAGVPNQDGIPWTLQGEAGFKYLIERAGSDFSWRPYLVIQNETGSVSFTTESSGETEFYRSRILD